MEQEKSRMEENRTIRKLWRIFRIESEKQEVPVKVDDSVSAVLERGADERGEC